jgi:hypothetical protein
VNSASGRHGPQGDRWARWLPECALAVVALLIGVLWVRAGVYQGDAGSIVQFGVTLNAVTLTVFFSAFAATAAGCLRARMWIVLFNMTGFCFLVLSVLSWSPVFLRFVRLAEGSLHGKQYLLFSRGVLQGHTRFLVEATNSNWAWTEYRILGEAVTGQFVPVLRPLGSSAPHAIHVVDETNIYAVFRWRCVAAYNARSEMEIPLSYVSIAALLGPEAAPEVEDVRAIWACLAEMGASGSRLDRVGTCVPRDDDLRSVLSAGTGPVVAVVESLVSAGGSTVFPDAWHYLQSTRRERDR